MDEREILVQRIFELQSQIDWMEDDLIDAQKELEYAQQELQDFDNE